jgi:hypothetical protein
MTPNPTPADRLEAALEYFKNGCEEPEGTPDYLNYGVHIDALTEFATAHLADLRREKVADSETPSTIHKPDSCLPAIHKDAVKRALELMERHWDGYSTAKEIITNAALLNKEIAE